MVKMSYILITLPFFRLMFAILATNMVGGTLATCYDLPDDVSKYTVNKTEVFYSSHIFIKLYLSVLTVDIIGKVLMLILTMFLMECFLYLS